MAPDAAIASLTARRTVRSAAVWGYAFAAYVASSAYAFATTYKTPEARAKLAEQFGSNAGLNAVVGQAHGIDTVGGFTAWRSLGVLSVVGAVWALLTGTRLLRGEEDSGRWELLLAGRTTRVRATALAVGGLAAGLVPLFVLPAVATYAVGLRGDVAFSAGSSAYLALALVCGAAMFLAIGALAAQLAATRRQASMIAAAVLGGAFLLRMVADSGAGLDALRWASPLGWVEELRPMSGRGRWRRSPCSLSRVRCWPCRSPGDVTSARACCRTVRMPVRTSRSCAARSPSPSGSAGRPPWAGCWR
jgi:ABC-2 type transport system permease protein